MPSTLTGGVVHPSPITTRYGFYQVFAGAGTSSSLAFVNDLVVDRTSFSSYPTAPVPLPTRPTAYTDGGAIVQRSVAAKLVDWWFACNASGATLHVDVTTNATTGVLWGKERTDVAITDVTGSGGNTGGPIISFLNNRNMTWSAIMFTVVVTGAVTVWGEMVFRSL